MRDPLANSVPLDHDMETEGIVSHGCLALLFLRWAVVHRLKTLHSRSQNDRWSAPKATASVGSPEHGIEIRRCWRSQKSQGNAAVPSRLSEGPVSDAVAGCRRSSSQDSSTTPRVPSTTTICPSFSSVMTPRTDITAGSPISRAVTAPCESGPPLSVTTADAL